MVRFTVLSAAMAGAGTAATTPNTAAAIRLSPATVLLIPLSLPAPWGVTRTAGRSRGQGVESPGAATRLGVQPLMGCALLERGAVSSGGQQGNPYLWLLRE